MQYFLNYVKKKELEILLSKLKQIEEPKVYLEQYSTPAEIAADILWKAFLRGDIENKVVGDFGCGNGIFGVGAHLLGAKKVIFLDIDENAIEVAKQNANFDAEFIVGDISKAPKVDTCFSNPPFGIQSENEHFVDEAIEKAKVCYLILPAGRRIKGEIIGKYKFRLPRIFEFHKKKFYEFNVEVFRVEKFK